MFDATKSAALCGGWSNGRKWHGVEGTMAWESARLGQESWFTSLDFGFLILEVGVKLPTWQDYCEDL